MTCQVMRDGDMDPPPKELCTLILARICTVSSSALKGRPVIRQFTAECRGRGFAIGLKVARNRDCK